MLLQLPDQVQIGIRPAEFLPVRFFGKHDGDRIAVDHCLQVHILAGNPCPFVEVDGQGDVQQTGVQAAGIPCLSCDTEEQPVIKVFFGLSGRIA